MTDRMYTVVYVLWYALTARPLPYTRRRAMDMRCQPFLPPMKEDEEFLTINKIPRNPKKEVKHFLSQRSKVVHPGLD